MKNKVFVIGAVIAAVVVFSVIVMTTKSPEAPSPTVESAAQFTQSEDAALFVRPHSPSVGNSLARVTVVEWFDPECKSCRMFHPVVKKLIAEYEKRVLFVYRYMPYHKNSMYAASALEEAREMGKFEQALDVLFEKQPKWGDHHSPQPEFIPEFLAILGIPKAKLDPEYVINKHGAKVKIDQSDGERLGVQGTPSFFVNGRFLETLGEGPLREMIDGALAK
mgnify:CR=1 FL=1